MTRMHANAPSDVTQPGRGRDDTMRMRTILVLILGLGAACGTKPNPDVCCTDVDQCAAIGVSDGLRLCGGAGQVCTPAGVCVASQCDVNADCTDAASPICIAHACVAKCVMDADCMDPAAAKCDSDGVCVACVDNAQCTAETAPACDATSHMCRACTADADCDSGVCLEFSGECAVTSRLIVVSPSGASNGQCDAGHPCLTIVDAMALITGERDVIRIVGGKVQTGKPSIDVPHIDAVIVDGDATAAVGPGSGSAVFEVEQGATLTLEGVAISGTGPSSRVMAVNNIGGQVVITKCALTHSGFTLGIGTLAIDSSVLDDFVATQTGGVAKLENNHSSAFSFTMTSGDATLERNVLGGDGAETVEVDGGRVTLDNNLITSTDSFEDAIRIQGATAGSTFRFNTMVNTSGVDNTATSVNCTANTFATSNIIAWNSSGRLECVSTYSLYDTFANPGGGGNQSADASAFFIDYAHQNYHLSATSPALGHGDPAVTNVTVDLDGNPRPNPAGSAPDVGAFEAP